MRYKSLKNHKRHFLYFTGITVGEFEKLVETIKPDWKLQNRMRLLEKPDRKRNAGGGRKKILHGLEDQLLLVLMWARVYPTYIMLEYIFGIDESTISRLIPNVLHLMKNKLAIHKGRRKIRTIEELREILPKGITLEEIITDATEQKIQRPQDRRKRKSYHSGKKQTFTQKTQITTNGKGYIINAPDSVGGRMHDYRLFKKSNIANKLPDALPHYTDSGYQGANKDYPNADIILPHKRTRKRKYLTKKQKRFNKKQRSIRITVEHTNAGLKQFRVLAETYRHSRKNYTNVFQFVANIFNFRMLSRDLA